MLDGSVASQKHPFITWAPFQDYLEHYLMAESDLSNRFHYQGLECGMEIVVFPKLGTMHGFSSHALKAQFDFYVSHIVRVYFPCPFEIEETVCLLNCIHTA